MEVNVGLWAAPLSIDHNGYKQTCKFNVMFCQPGSSQLNETETAQRVCFEKDVLTAESIGSFDYVLNKKKKKKWMSNSI